MYSVRPKQPIPKLLLVLSFNTRSILLLLSLLPSQPVHLRGERFWWSSFQTCCVRCLASRRRHCRATQLNGDVRVAANTRPAGDSLSVFWARKEQEGRHSVHSHTYWGRRKKILTFWALIQLPRNVGRFASCWRCKCKHRREICFPPTYCTDIHAWRAKSALLWDTHVWRPFLSHIYKAWAHS